ncbi:MAG: hypothetical protein RBS48_04510 [Ignavibacteriaceae bacterium]|jgi:hypothetical protein|nr:hypothetical protein [Ignavibacteriaceae bacterium]
MPSFSHSWLPFIYLYGVGGIFFIGGMILIKKAKILNPERKLDRRWKWLLYFGFFYYLAIHFIMIIAALYW